MLKNCNLVKLGTILVESKEEVATPDPNKRIRVRLNVQGVEKRPETNDVEGATKYYHRKRGQFIYGKQNLFKGAFGVVPVELDGFESSSDLPAFDVDKSCNPEWIYYFLRNGRFYERLVTLSTGTGSRRVQPKRLYDLELPLPERKAQDELILGFKAIERGKRDLDTDIRENIDRIQNLRQAILKEAVSGKLVSQDPNDEPILELLRETKAEKERLIADKRIKKEKALPPITQEEITYPLPNGWEWVRLIDLIALEKNAMKRGPFGGSLRKDIFVKNGYLVYEQRHAIHNDFNYEKYFITPQKFEEMIMFRVVPGDLIISCSGVTLGKISEIPEGAKEGIINQALLKIRLNNRLIKNSFFISLFNSTIFQARIFEKAKGSAIPNMVGVDGLKRMVIGLPPLREQERIVLKIGGLMELLNDLEVKIEEGRNYSQLLMETVLKEAFAS